MDNSDRVVFGEEWENFFDDFYDPSRLSLCFNDVWSNKFHKFILHRKDF